MADIQLQDAVQRATQLEMQKQNWIPLWQETAKWVAPWRNKYLSHSMHEVGETNSETHILDATASRSLRVLAAGLQSGLTSPARPWFRLRRGGKDATESGPERRWLDEVEAAIYAAFAGSNFYQAIHNLYTELAVFGSATMYMEADDEHVLRCHTLSCGEFSWSCNASGRVDTVLRKSKMTTRQVIQQWGETTASAELLKQHAKNPDTFVEVTQLVRPRKNINPTKMGKSNMPFASYIWESGTKGNNFLHKGGYEEFPFLCARWDVLGGDVYGRSPAMEALPDIRMLQEMTKSQILAIHKVVNPPMRVPANYKQRLSLIPGAINYISPNQPEGIGPLYQINPDIAAISRKIEDVREAVREGFFTDLFLLFTGDSRSNVTATEVLERGQEKMLMLGPVIERHQTEILDPLLVRAFGIISRANILPPPPSSLSGNALRIEYVSSLAQAQRFGGAEIIRRLIQEVSTIAGVCPSVLDKIDFEQAVDELASISGAPARIVRSDKEVEALRLERTSGTGIVDQGEDVLDVEGLLAKIMEGNRADGENLVMQAKDVLANAMANEGE